MLRSSIRILVAAMALFASAPAFASDEVDCILDKFSPAQTEILAVKTITDLLSSSDVGDGQGAERDAALAYGRFSEECEAENGWNKDQADAAGDYTLLALAARGSRITLKRQGVPVDALDAFYAARPQLSVMETPQFHVAPGPQTDPWSTALIADIRKAGIALPGDSAGLVPTYIALLAWRDQRRGEFGD